MKEIFTSIKCEDDKGSWQINDIKVCDGEATINNRKGKLIFFYEWNLKLNYTGQLNDSTSEMKGTIDIPNLSDENDAGDLEITVVPANDSKNNQRMKDHIREKGRPIVRSACMQYVKDLKLEYSSGVLLPTKNGAIPTKPEKTDKSIDIQKEFKEMNTKDQKETQQSKVRISEVKLKLKETFQTDIDQIFQALTTKSRVSAFTRASCEIDPKPGGKFSMLAGNITGEFVEFVPNQKIVQKWRFKSWPEGVESLVTLEFKQEEDGAKVILEQTGVPDSEMDRTKQGWKQNIFGPIKQTFGYGANLF
jgi:activator of HSP90 ATPase